MKAAKKKKKYVAHVELLQNGYPIVSKSFTSRKRQRLVLGAKQRYAFCIPHYDFDRTLKFATANQNAIVVNLPGSWEGFSSGGERGYDFIAKSKGRHRLRLNVGDFASFHKDDLSLLFKISPEAPLAKAKATLRFRPQFWSLFFTTPSDIKAFVSACIVASLALVPITLTLNSLDVKRPTSLRDLSLEYALPFIYPKHFANLPEALQEDFDRRDYKLAAINYAQAFTDMFMNWPTKLPKIMFPSSRKLIQGQFIERDQRLSEIREAQQAQQEKALAKPYAAVISIPSVQGESVIGSIGRIFDKIDSMHASLDQGLELRRKMVSEFQEDPEYSFSDYKHGSIKQSKDAKEALSKVSPFSMLSNEEVMYKQANDLARQALSSQERMSKPLNPEENALFARKFAPIALPPVHNGLSHLHLSSFHLSDDKINALMASEYSASPKAGHVKEPLIGDVEPTLIERTVKKRQYQLQLCYELALRKNRKIKGEMEWSWRIDSLGQISELALVSSSISDKSMETCVKKKIASWSFPRPKRGSVEIRYPFVFEKDRG